MRGERGVGVLLNRRGILGAGCAMVMGRAPAHAQDGPPPPSPIEARTDFNVDAGKFLRLEHAPSSARIRSGVGGLHIRFQFTEVHRGTQWLPLIGFSLLDSTEKLSIKIDFVDVPTFEHLVMSAERIDRTTRASEYLAKVQVPRYTRSEVHEFDLALEPGAAIVTIDGKRRALKRDFEVHSLMVSPSSVKGWVEFPEPASA